jgi:MFS family permease
MRCRKLTREAKRIGGVTALASFMAALDTRILTAALATLRADFGAPMEALQWTVNAFNLSFAVLPLTGAALGDRFGRRRLPWQTGLRKPALDRGIQTLT